jgi:purine-cytosine permease-like protein
VRKFFTSLFAFILPGIVTVIVQWLFMRRRVKRAQAGFGRSGASA